MGHQVNGFAFPNDGHVLWSLMIVLYPYITGIVAGAFVVSSLYLIFGREELKPVARLSLVAALGFLAAAPLPLQLHLGHPERSFNVLITPNFSSAMAAFGYIYSLFFALLALQVWLVYRKVIVQRACDSSGLKGLVYKFLALGVYDVSEEAVRIDQRVVNVLAGVGIPIACVLTGYVGFIFGSVKANYWWSSTLMPVIFVFSAVTCGLAMVTIVYQAAARLTRQEVEGDCVQALANWLWLFMIVTIVLELLEVGMLAYERNEEWLVIGPLLFDTMKVSFWGVQVLLGSLVPFLLLGIVVLRGRTLSAIARNGLALVASALLLVQVFAMRWNVVIGGQMFSKSLGGFRKHYVPHFLEKEGIASAIVICLVPFVFLAVFGKIFPLFPKPEAGDGEQTAEAEPAA